MERLRWSWVEGFVSSYIRHRRHERLPHGQGKMHVGRGRRSGRGRDASYQAKLRWQWVGRVVGGTEPPGSGLQLYPKASPSSPELLLLPVSLSAAWSSLVILPGLSSRSTGSVGTDGCPRPAEFTACTLNMYCFPGCKSDTWG